MAVHRRGAGARGPNGTQQAADWPAIQAHYVARNLARQGRDPEYTLKQLSADLGLHYPTVRNTASEGRWRPDMHRRMEQRASAGMTAAQRDAEATEAEVRKSQARAARILQRIGLNACEVILRRQEANPELLLPGDQAVLRNIERFVRTGLEQERAALGLDRVVEIAEQMGDESPLTRLAEHREAQHNANRLLAWLDGALVEAKA